MSRAGEEMILELATLLGTETVKTAAKKEDEEEKEGKKHEEKESKEFEKGEKEEEKEAKKEKKEKKEKKDKKATLIMSVVQDLVKLAGELDEMGADEASSLVDDALRVIVDSIEKKK